MLTEHSLARTHRFYAAEGFVPLEVLPTLWDEENPCLPMAKVLRVAAPLHVR